MTNWKNLLLLLSLTINVAAAATLFYFWGHYDGMRRLPALLQRPDRDAGPPGPLWQTMGLQEPQKRELAKLRTPFNARINQLRFDLEQTRRQLMKVLETQPAAQDSISSLLNRMMSLQAQLDRSTVEHLQTLRPFLDDRQWHMMLLALTRERREVRETRPFNPLKRF